MTTLANLETQLARDLRDTGNVVFSTAELDDLINQGISQIGAIYPREIVQTIGTVAAGTYSYAASSFTHIYRLDIYSSAGSYQYSVPQYLGDSPDSGYEFHGGVVYLPRSITWTAGDTIQAFGYGGYTQLAASSATTDVDATGLWAVRVFAQAEAFERLISDRATFQQWQASPGNSDVSALGVAQLAQTARRRWREEQQRLRRMRKV